VTNADADVDLGLTHVAFYVSDLDRSIAFYEKYADMQVVHRRHDGGEVAWISDRTRPFVLVLIRSAAEAAAQRFSGHLGIGCVSVEEVDRRAAEAEAEGILAKAPQDSGYPVGYWCLVRDPDGYLLELTYGQEVALTVEQA
jgi:catechol 2,3-dioxygenase-like lactoylglutathione lyase family enzyme